MSAPEPEQAAGAPEAPTPGAPAPDEPAADATPPARPPGLEHARPARLRRAPRFGAFIGAGVLLALLLTAVLVAVVPPPAGAGRGTVFLYLGLTLGVVCALVGAVLAVLADRRRQVPRR